MDQENGNSNGKYKEWKAGEIEDITETPEESFRHYEKQLALVEEDLVGKNILDVGSRDSLFGKYLNTKYRKTKVTSVDIDPDSKAQVIASARNLPFKENFFDFIVQHAVPLSEKGLVESVGENLRVLKVGGEMRIGPIGKWEFSGGLWANLHIFLEKNKDKADFEDIPIADRKFDDGTTEKQFYVKIIKRESLLTGDPAEE